MDDDDGTVILAFGEDLRLHDEAEAGNVYELVSMRELHLEKERFHEIMALAEQHGAVLIRDRGTLSFVVHLDGPRWRVAYHHQEGDRFCHDGFPFLAITPSLECKRAWTAMLPPEQLIGYRDASGARVWETAHWTLRSEAPRACDWTRIYEGQAWHGARMAITCAAPLATIRALVEPCPWPRVEPDVYQSPSPDSMFGARHHLAIADGTLDLYRAGTNVVEYDCYELDVLARVADGALGEVGWDVWDTEYGGLIVTGDDTASLAAYLSRDCDLEAMKAHVKRVCEVHVHTTSATTFETAIDHFARSVGASSHDELRAIASRFDAIPRYLAIDVQFVPSPDDVQRLVALIGHRRRRCYLRGPGMR